MDDETVIEKEIVNLSEFAEDEWFADRSKSTYWLRIYTSLGLTHKDFFPAIKDVYERIDRDPPVRMYFGQIDGLEVPIFRINMYVNEDGITAININSDNHKIDKSNHVWFATPYKIDGDPGNHVETNRYLNRIESLIVLHMGQNFLRDIVFDGEVNAYDGNFSVASQAIKMPQMPEGPFLHKQNWQDIEEIETSLSSAPIEIRNRLQLSLEFFERGVREDDGFFEYWTALEILCNGKAQTIRSKIQKCYKLKHVKEAEERSGFKSIAKWRHDFVHKGDRPNVSSDVERYIQLLYLDLLRQELKLQPRHHMAGLQQAVGYDLSPINLPDNRTEEQKQAVIETEQLLEKVNSDKAPNKALKTDAESAV